MGVGDEIRGDEIWEGGRKFVGMKSRGGMKFVGMKFEGDEIRRGMIKEMTNV